MSRELNKDWNYAEVDPSIIVAGIGLLGGAYTTALRSRQSKREQEAAMRMAQTQAAARERRTRIITYSILGIVGLTIGGIIVYKLTKK